MKSTQKDKIIHTVDLNCLTTLCCLTVHHVTFHLYLSPNQLKLPLQETVEGVTQKLDTRKKSQ